MQSVKQRREKHSPLGDAVKKCGHFWKVVSKRNGISQKCSQKMTVYLYLFFRTHFSGKKVQSENDSLFEKCSQKMTVFLENAARKWRHMYI